MRLEVQGLFAGKWIKLEYEINEDVLKSKIEEDTLLGYDTIEDFKVEHNYEDSLKILKRLPNAIKMTSGGRLDIIARTNPKVLNELSDYRLERDNLTLLERLIEVFKHIEDYPIIEEYVEMCISITNVGDAVSILKAKRI